MDTLYKSVFDNNYLKDLIFSQVKTFRSVKYDQVSLGWMIENSQWTLLKEKLAKNDDIIVTSKDSAFLIFKIKEEALFHQLFEKLHGYYSKEDFDQTKIDKVYNVNCIEKAIEHDNLFAVRFLINNGFPYPKHPSKSLEVAVKNNNFELSRLLVQHSNMYSLKAITTAIQNNHLNIAQFLLNNGQFDTTIFYSPESPSGAPKVTSFDPLLIAIKFGNIKMFKMVLKHLKRKHQNKDLKPSNEQIKESYYNGKVLKYIFTNYHPQISEADLKQMLEYAIQQDQLISVEFLFKLIQNKDQDFVNKLTKLAFSKGSLPVFNILNGNSKFDYSIYSYSQVKALSSSNRFKKFLKLSNSESAINGGLKVTHGCVVQAAGALSKNMYKIILNNSNYVMSNDRLLVNDNDISVSLVQRALECQNFGVLRLLIELKAMPICDEMESMSWTKYSFPESAVDVLHHLFTQYPIAKTADAAFVRDLMMRSIANERPIILGCLIQLVMNSESISDYTPFLDVAFTLSNTDFLDFLVKKGSIIEISPPAIKNIRSTVQLDYLIKKKINFNTEYALYSFIANHNLDCVEYMLSGADQSWKTPSEGLINSLGKCGNIKTIKLFYSFASQCHSKPDYEGIYKLAVDNTCLEIIEFLNEKEPPSTKFSVFSYVSKTSASIFNKFIKLP